MKSSVFTAAVFAIAISVMSGLAGAGEIGHERAGTTRPGVSPLSDLVIFNERTGEIFDLKQRSHLDRKNLIGTRDPGPSGSISICHLVFAYCLSLTQEDLDADDGSWPSVDCLCDSGCLTPETHDSICNYKL